MLDTAIVILNWNGEKHLETYLPSVAKHSQGARIFVADNGSTDGSKGIVDRFDNVAWLPLPQNYGFAEGYNRALAQVEAEVYVLLNSDVRVTDGWLNAPLRRLESDERVAAVQPKILADLQPDSFEYAGAAGGFIDALGYPYCRGRVFETVELDRGQYDEAVEVDWASGACCFVRASAWHILEGLDGDFFAHMEEIDFCWRLRRAGFTCWVEPASTVYHLGGGTLQYNNPRKTYLNFRNSLHALLKNANAWTVLFLLLARLVLDGVTGVKFLLGGQAAATWAIVRAHFAFYRRIPKNILLRQIPKSDYPGSAKSVLAKAPTSIVFSYYVLGKKRFQDFFSAAKSTL